MGRMPDYKIWEVLVNLAKDRGSAIYISESGAEYLARREQSGKFSLDKCHKGKTEDIKEKGGD